MIWDLLWVHIGFSSHKWPIRSNEYHLPLGHKVWPLTSNRYPLCFLGDCPIGVRLLLFGICIWGPTLYEQIIHFSLLDYPKFRKRFFQISKKKTIQSETPIWRYPIRIKMEKLKPYFPILTWGPNYQKEYLIRDFIAGFTVALTVVPQVRFHFWGWVFSRVIRFSVFFLGLNFEIIGPHANILLTPDQGW